jgi:DNA repair protein RadA/Sms
VVLQFDGDRHSTLRMVRGIKNRFGAADEVGCFELTDDGITGLPDPSGLFLTHRDSAVPGTAVTVVVEGKRPLLGEVQALVAESALANPRRAVSGLDSSRVAMILAVIERRGGVRLAGSDVYTATVGGMRVVEPAADLAVALAVASAAGDLLLPPHTVAIGEVGLAGELRPVAGLRRRLAEASRLGFQHALVPPESGPENGSESAPHHAPDGGAPPAGIRLHRVADLGAALQWLR